MILSKLETVTFDEATQMGVVLLTVEKRAIPIWVGLFEAQSIMLKLQGSSFPRPLTHDLLKNCIEQLGGEPEFILINKLEKTTYFAQIHVNRDRRKVVLDARPSDAIALSVRANLPIYIDEKVFQAGSVEIDDFLKEQKSRFYRSYLESLDDDELGKMKH